MEEVELLPPVEKNGLQNRAVNGVFVELLRMLANCRGNTGHGDRRTQPIFVHSYFRRVCR